MLVDEVHLLAESRGHALEAGAVSRIKMVGALHKMRGVSLPSYHRNLGMPIISAIFMISRLKKGIDLCSLDSGTQQSSD